jgi:hypothetical protein
LGRVQGGEREQLTTRLSRKADYIFWHDVTTGEIAIKSPTVVNDESRKDESRKSVKE